MNLGDHMRELAAELLAARDLEGFSAPPPRTIQNVPLPEEVPPRRVARRHPAKVTADRLLADVERYWDHFTPAERDMVATVRTRLLNIAEGTPDA